MSPGALPPWQRTGLKDGVATYRLRSWSEFGTFIDTHVFRDRGRAEHGFIWRGHRRSDWELETSLDRLFARVGYGGDESKLERRSLEHLDDFRYAARGRRGLNPPALNENEWWALAQHFGLATPLLDWSRSPFAAAYFAFESHQDGTDYRVIWGLDIDAVRLRNKTITEEQAGDDRPTILELIDPLSDENPRLVNQGALFTRGPIGLPVNLWVNVFFVESDSEVLLRIEVPGGDRTECLRALNRMNINHLSLFPDLTGATRATNLRTELDLLREE
jgi:hypothetical protein